MQGEKNIESKPEEQNQKQIVGEIIVIKSQDKKQQPRDETKIQGMQKQSVNELNEENIKQQPAITQQTTKQTHQNVKQQTTQNKVNQQNNQKQKQTQLVQVKQQDRKQEVANEVKQVDTRQIQPQQLKVIVNTLNKQKQIQIETKKEQKIEQKALLSDKKQQIIVQKLNNDEKIQSQQKKQQLNVQTIVDKKQQPHIDIVEVKVQDKKQQLQKQIKQQETKQQIVCQNKKSIDQNKSNSQQKHIAVDKAQQKNNNKQEQSIKKTNQSQDTINKNKIIVSQNIKPTIQAKKEDKKQQQITKTKQSSNPLKQFFKSKTNPLLSKKQKFNPLLVNVDIEQQQQIKPQPQQQTKIRQQQRKSSNCSVLSLPSSLKQQAIDIVSHQNQQISQILEKVKQQIKVQIIACQQKGSTLNKYMLYTIKGEDMHGPFMIKRKYSQFVALRKILIDRWPGCYIPGLRNKFNIKNKSEEQQTLKKVLVNFLVGLSFTKYFYYKQEVQLFLRSPDIDIEDMFKQMPALRSSDLISRFQYALGSQLQQLQAQNLNTTTKISKFHKKLKAISTSLQKICQQLYKLAQSYQNYTANLNKFNEAMKVYQHISLAQFTGNSRQMTILVKDQQRHLELNLSNKQNNYYYEIYRTILIEQVDTKSLSDILLSLQMYYIKKEALQNQIAQNEKQKNTLKPNQTQANPTNPTSSSIKSLPTVVLTSKKYQQQKLTKIQQLLKKLYQQKQHVNKLVDIVEFNVVRSVIPMFKLLKRNKYCNMLKKYCEITNKHLNQEEHVWRFLNAETKKMGNLILNK